MRTLSLLLLLAALGCQPAGRYGVTVPRSTRLAPTPSRLVDTPAEEVWLDPNPAEMDPAVPIAFVHEGKDPAAWDQLKAFWNDTKPGPADAAFHFAVWPPGVGVLVKPPEPRVKIKVPLGLDDPTPHIPASNPPTRGKWELGKQLFFDADTFLQPANAETKQSCATCHDPAKGFTDRKVYTGGDRCPPTLINSVYNRYQFWDGRAGALEEVLAAHHGGVPNQKHCWSGAVDRLRAHSDYPTRFRQVFGTLPTEDAIGKALATYLRTVLVGNAVHDRAAHAARQRSGLLPDAADYEKALDDAAVKGLLDKDAPLTKPEMAQQLARGFRLFTNEAGCSQCHRGSNFTDGSFHNLGIGASSGPQRPGAETGRFPVTPIGLKERGLIGATKTPTLRSLLRTRPYFHDGTRDDLFAVVAWHVRLAPPSRYLAPEIRKRDLKEDDVQALVLFLKALEGDLVPEVVAR